MMYPVSVIPTAVQGGNGLTLKEILEGIPTDLASIFIYLLVLVSLTLVVLGSRKKPGRGKPGT